MRKQKNQPQRRYYADADELCKRIEDEKPKNGQAESEKDKIDQETFKKLYKINFSDLPISQQTIDALAKREFQQMTEIQRCTIPHALCGRDILGASKTGSGKTISYLLPVIENLYRQKWSEMDGLGGLIICPTRELALQVFEVARELLQFHQISVALIIGGKSFDFEKENIHRINLVICTPGRLLQHMEQSYGFNADNLQLLVIDEIDMLLELGFSETLNAILEYIPPDRQTLLFSATLGRQVHELARFSLKTPEYIFLHDVSKNPDKKKSIKDIFEAPQNLTQYYMIIPIQEKINILYSFLRAHPKQKILVFLSTCKQVRFFYESFTKIKVGTTLLELQGRQKQPKRTAIYFTFQQKQSAILFTTNVAARGLDFPNIDWVVQVDVPESTELYIHRVGRTARYKSEGKSLLLVIPQEVKFLDKLKSQNFILNKIQQNPQKKFDIKAQLQSLLTEDIDIKYLAQRAFICYLKSVYNQSDKEVFNVHKISTEDLAESFGLIQVPIIKFKKIEESKQDSDGEVQQRISYKKFINLKASKKMSKLEKFKLKIAQKNQQKQEDNDEENGEKLKKKQQTAPSHLKKINRHNDNVLSSKFQNMRKNSENSDEEDFLQLKRKHTEFEDDPDLKRRQYELSKRQLKKIKFDGHFNGKNKIIFDLNTGEKKTVEDVQKENYAKIKETVEQENVNYALQYQMKVDEHKVTDIQNEKTRRKEKRIKRKNKNKETVGQAVELGSGSD